MPVDNDAAELVQPAVPQENADESTTATSTEVDGEETDQQADAKEGEQEEHPSKRSGYQRQKAKNQRLERELEYWRTVALSPKSAQEPAETPKVEAPADDKKPIRPRIGDFATIEEYEAALDEHEEKLDSYNERRQAKLIENQRKAEQEQSKKLTTEQNWQRKYASAQKKFSDFDEVVEDAIAANVSITTAMKDVLMEDELGAEIFYYLSKNTDLAASIAKMGDLRAAVALGNIKAQLASPKVPVKEEPTPEEEPPAPPPTSKAPPPITPVRKAAPGPIDLDKAPFKDFVKQREADIAKRRK